MNSLINSNYNRTYNPRGSQNALCEIKKLLTSRDTEAQCKACGYLIQVINRYKINSKENVLLVEYLLDNDITVFLCEAISNLDFSLFKSVLTCLHLLWRNGRFFSEEHAAHTMTAILRALTHYFGTRSYVAVDCCLQFLRDLLSGISYFKTTPVLSHQSAYSTVQLLFCLNTLASEITTNPDTILLSAIVLQNLISYQPDNLAVRGNVVSAVAEIANQWFVLLVGALNHSMLIGDEVKSGMFLVIICHLGVDFLRLAKLLHSSKQKTDLVETILMDEQETKMLLHYSVEMKNTVCRVITDLVSFVKENQNQIENEVYCTFLKFLLSFLYENVDSDVISEFCELLFSNGYLIMIPQVQITRNDRVIRKVSTLILGEMLKVLSEKYLNTIKTGKDTAIYTTDIHMGLVELQNGINKPQSLGSQLQKNKPYSLFIYLYFYCQSSENPGEATGPLLPYLVDHILNLSKSFLPPPYIIKAMWLIFAMSTISNDSLQSLEERVYLAKATNRLVSLLYPETSVFYTHNPAILLWAFTSSTIPTYVRVQVLSQWLSMEDTIPEELTNEPMTWELLLNVLVQNTDSTITGNCMKILNISLDAAEQESKDEFAKVVWSSLPEAMSKSLIEDNDIDLNICYLLDIATILSPNEIDQCTGLKVAILMATLFSKNKDHITNMGHKYHYEYVCLKLGLYLLRLAYNQNDNRVLLIYTNRPAFLPSVLEAINSLDDRVACAALQLLLYVVHYFNKNKYEPKNILKIHSDLVIKSLRKDGASERGASLLQLLYTILNSDRNTPLVLTYEITEYPSVDMLYIGLRALMFRIQLMLCCRDSKSQSQVGWKTLSSIFTHAIRTKSDLKLVATLTSQPWTFTLVQFQLSQNITEEFLTFLYNWLTLLAVTIEKNQEKTKKQLSKYSLVMRTVVMLKNKLAMDEELKELKGKILSVVWDIVEFSGIRVN